MQTFVILDSLMAGIKNKNKHTPTHACTDNGDYVEKQLFVYVVFVLEIETKRFALVIAVDRAKKRPYAVRNGEGRWFSLRVSFSYI